MIRVLSAIRSRPWAITQEALDTILSIAERDNETPQAVAAKLGRPLENTYDVENRGGVAVLPVAGPLFRYANLFTAISGATSYDMLARDFAAAIANPNVDAIVLNIDSPGGEANGVAEFADQIFAARGSKPIIAYVDGMAASAAYWIASAADSIVTNDTGLLGSIGVVTSVLDTRERDAKAGVRRHEIVSSQSPDKRVDVATDEGRGKVQALVDTLADIFIGKVARNRGVDPQTVINDFGQGGVLVGQAAVDAGLADRIGNFEGLISELQARAAVPVRAIAAAGGAQQEVTMDQQHGAPDAATQPEPVTAASIAANHPDVAEALRAEGRTEARVEGEGAGRAHERARISAILGSAEAAERRDLASHLAFETDTAAEAAIALLAKAPKTPAANGFGNFDAAMRKEGVANVGADREASADDALIETARAMGLAK